MEILRCYDSCPFIKNGIVRPCSEKIFSEQEGPCAQQIAADPTFEGQGLRVEVTMDSHMSKSVRLKKGSKNEAIVRGGFVYRQNISEY